MQVQLPEWIAVYELSACEESEDIGYVLKVLYCVHCVLGDKSLHYVS